MIIDNKNEDLADPVNVAKAYSDTAKLAAFTSCDIIATIGLKADICSVHSEIVKHLRSTLKGDPHDQETILISQGKTLDLLFNNLLSKSLKSRCIEEMKGYMDMAFKAQNQARKTIVSLQSIQNPQHQTFIKQQNLAVNQQINNDSPIKKKFKSKNELLTIGENYAELDIRRAKKTIGTNQAMESMV